jgi:hypothetical protein
MKKVDAGRVAAIVCSGREKNACIQPGNVKYAKMTVFKFM